MSRPLPTRPGAPKRGGPPSQGTTNSRPSQDLAEVRNLPDFADDGPQAELDPENASSGRITDETVDIVGAKFAKQDWRRKDGSYPENAVPETQLVIQFRRDGDEATDRPYTEQYKYGLFALFAPTKDGNSVGVRPSVIKEGANAPRPRKTAPAILFLQSIKDAGGKSVIERIKTEGAKALIGLRVHVRSRKVDGMHENAKPVLLVDYVDPSTAAVDNKAAAPKSAPTASTAPQQVNAGSDAETLAAEALVDLLSAAEGNSIVKSDIAKLIIRTDKWKSHPQRPAILATLRTDSFLTREGSAWVVDGVNIVLA